MSVLRKLFGIDKNHLAEDVNRQEAVASRVRLERERQEYRQTVQRVDSGARVLENKNNLFKTWDEGLQLIARKNDD